LGHVPELLRALDTLAVVLESNRATTADAVEIARLLGGTAAARRRLALQPFPADRPALARARSRVRVSLGDGPWAAELERGAAQSLDDVARRVLRMRGSRLRPTSGWDSLTPTEWRVAELAAEGLRNLEIADRLVVAPGTVKIHLSHIFAKLGVHSRSELAAAYARQQPK
jgi:DNA-binding CsgD family transcriptional regulator